MRIGVVGYGFGGRYFHTPFIAAARNFQLSGIVARAPATIATAKTDWPDVPVFHFSLQCGLVKLYGSLLRF